MVFNYISKRPIITLAVICILILISIPFQLNIDRSRDKFDSIKQTIYLNSSILNKMSLGYKELLADIYWMRALQFFGSDNENFAEKDSKVLYEYFDIITDLDPKFVNAYRYGGTFLAEPLPVGLGDFSSGVNLFEKGREKNPDNFRLPLEEGFLYYIYLKDYKKAAELFNEAAEKPGLSDFRRASLKGMAGSALKFEGNRELSKEIWNNIYETTQNENRKNFALQNLKELNTNDFEDKLTTLATEYKSHYGKFPENLNDLLEAGYLKKIPLDHSDEEFIVIKQNETVKSSSLLKKYLKENIRLINAKSKRHNSLYGSYPESIEALKDFINEETIMIYPQNPFGKEYDYDPETGQISFKSELLD